MVDNLLKTLVAQEEAVVVGEILHIKKILPEEMEELTGGMEVRLIIILPELAVEEEVRELLQENLENQEEIYTLEVEVVLELRVQPRVD